MIFRNIKSKINKLLNSCVDKLANLDLNGLLDNALGKWLICVADEARKFFWYCFSDKKIIIITQRKTINIPIATEIQVLFVSVVIFVMLTISYTTQKYLTFADLISEKDKKIWTTSVANKNLQYQVTDMRENLKELDSYFNNISKYKNSENISSNSKTATNPNIANNDVLSNDKTREGAEKILLNIKDKVKHRISTLESVLTMTGLSINQIAENSYNLSYAIKARASFVAKNNSSSQGGPFVENKSALSPDKATSSLLDRDMFNADIRYLLELENIVHAFPLASPMDSYYISSYFGSRMDPIKNISATHSGVDIVGGIGQPVYSTAAGVVKKATLNGSYGRLVEIKHSYNLSTRYAHLLKVFVRRGQRVKAGQLIGLEGNSGRSTGSHLHYEVVFNNKAIDPYKFLQAGKYVFQQK